MNNAEAGYAIIEQVFDRRVMMPVREALETSELPRTKAGARHVLRVPVVRALASHDALMRIAGEFVGPEPIPFRATLFDKSAAANWRVAWHQDTALPIQQRRNDLSWGPWSIKAGVLHAIAPAAALATVIALRVHLDDSTETNGPLRVLPGTHVRALPHDEIQRLAGVASVTCVCPEGGVVAMRPLIVHASSKATDDRPRRVLHIEYAATVRLGAGIDLAVG